MAFAMDEEGLWMYETVFRWTKLPFGLTKINLGQFGLQQPISSRCFQPVFGCKQTEMLR
jgi:hypothetical protein